MMCLWRLLCRLFFGVLGPDDPRDEAQRAAWRERRGRFRSRVRAAFRDLLDEGAAGPRADSGA